MERYQSLYCTPKSLASRSQIKLLSRVADSEPTNHQKERSESEGSVDMKFFNFNDSISQPFPEAELQNTAEKELPVNKLGISLKKRHKNLIMRKCEWALRKRPCRLGVAYDIGQRWATFFGRRAKIG